MMHNVYCIMSIYYIYFQSTMTYTSTNVLVTRIVLLYILSEHHDIHKYQCACDPDCFVIYTFRAPWHTQVPMCLWPGLYILSEHHDIHKYQCACDPDCFVIYTFRAPWHTQVPVCLWPGLFCYIYFQSTMTYTSTSVLVTRIIYTFRAPWHTQVPVCLWPGLYILSEHHDIHKYQCACDPDYIYFQSTMTYTSTNVVVTRIVLLYILSEHHDIHKYQCACDPDCFVIYTFRAPWHTQVPMCLWPGLFCYIYFQSTMIYTSTNVLVTRIVLLYILSEHHDIHKYQCACDPDCFVIYTFRAPWHTQVPMCLWPGLFCYIYFQSTMTYTSTNVLVTRIVLLYILSEHHDIHKYQCACDPDCFVIYTFRAPWHTQVPMCLWPGLYILSEHHDIHKYQCACDPDCFVIYTFRAPWHTQVPMCLWPGLFCYIYFQSTMTYTSTNVLVTRIIYTFRAPWHTQVPMCLWPGLFCPSRLLYWCAGGMRLQNERWGIYIVSTYILEPNWLATVT